MWTVSLAESTLHLVAAGGISPALYLGYYVKSRKNSMSPRATKALQTLYYHLKAKHMALSKDTVANVGVTVNQVSVIMCLVYMLYIW